MDFCEYLKEDLKDCRKKQNLTLTQAAQMMGISSSYLSSLEGGTRPAPAFEMLNKMADVLNLNKKERYRLYDLAAESKQPPALADDLNAYIYQNITIRDILRYSMECNILEDELETIFSFIKKNYHY